jgi:predicted RNA-binding protein YlqC (UPF0109 family)
MFSNLLQKTENEETMCLILTKDQVGRLIGHGGKTVTSLRKKFKNAKIKVFSDEKKVEISGDQKLPVYGYIKFYIL